MKKFLKIFIIILVVCLSIITFSFAANENVITNVGVTGIEAPFSENREIDTDGKVPNGAVYRIIDIAWKSPNESISGYYEVTVTLKANVGFVFSAETTGTVNGDSIAGKRLIDDDEISLTYIFDENSSTSSTINNATSTLRYRITVYCNTEKGTITPTVVRVLEGNNQTFKITPKDGYKIKDVKVDGESIGAVSEYTFKKVKEDHTIRAYFEEDNSVVNEIKPLLSIILNFIKNLM